MNVDWLPGSALTLLENGAEFFPALGLPSTAAGHEVVETCIFADDGPAAGRRRPCAGPPPGRGGCACCGWHDASSSPR